MRQWILVAGIFCSLVAVAKDVSLDDKSLRVGSVVDLSGTWQFKPTYLLKADEKPEAAADEPGYLSVPVPQMLSRIQWWLDDSEDFKKWEQKRLDALGFDTEKSDDGWYRKVIDVPALPKDRHLWLEFDGVAMRCKVYLNGKLLGEHAGMFSRFSFDLTPNLVAGKNVISIWVGMEKIAKTDAQLGEAVTVNLSAAKVVSMSKGMFGPLSPNQDNRAYELYGIWQPVKLVVRGAAKIEDVWFQPKEDLKSADVVVEVKSSGAVGTLSAEAFLVPAKGGKAIALATKLFDLGPQGGKVTMRLHSDEILPWTPAEPNCYLLDVTIRSADGQIVESQTHRVGFRTFEVKGNQFYLNGHRYWLRGANQLPYGKNPWDPKLAHVLIQALHDNNCRFTRTHATPWNEAWLDAADEIGLAVSIEGIRPWAFAGNAEKGHPDIMPPPAIFQHWLMENADVVKRCRNHPSVFIFTVGNEMLLRDSKNLEKWKLLSDVTKQTRELGAGHPIIVSSDYMRDPAFYEKTLKPAGIDDGDIDDMHRYNGWYGESAFVVDSKFEKELKNNRNERPLMGQEFATGYPDLDTGLPVLRYTKDLLTPQAWVGVYAYPGNDPNIWLAEHAKVTKRWAEMLRYQRDDNTAGFCLFSAECWFQHSYLPEAKAYPVVREVKRAFAPVGLALETSQRRFWSGDEISANVFVTNDDEQFRDLENLILGALVDVGTDQAGRTAAQLPRLKYYETRKVPIKIRIPQVLSREKLGLSLFLRDEAHRNEISSTGYEIEVFPRSAESQIPDLVIRINKGEPLDPLAEGGDVRKKIEDGATAIVFSPGKQLLKLFPEDFLEDKVEKGKPDPAAQIAEFADWYPARGTKLAEGLHPMDLKWWARKDDWRAFIAQQSQRLNPNGTARELIRFIPPHSYISADKIPAQYRTVMSEIRLGKGRLWICDLDLEASAKIDPAAAMFERNLYRAAEDPHSTDHLRGMPTHEEMLKGGK